MSDTTAGVHAHREELYQENGKLKAANATLKDALKECSEELEAQKAFIGLTDDCFEKDISNAKKEIEYYKQAWLYAIQREANLVLALREHDEDNDQETIQPER